MRKEEYQSKLWDLVIIGDYWSNKAFELNNKCIDEVGGSKYLKWHNEVMMKYQNKLVDFALNNKNKNVIVSKEHFGGFKEF